MCTYFASFKNSLSWALERSSSDFHPSHIFSLLSIQLPKWKKEKNIIIDSTDFAWYEKDLFSSVSPLNKGPSSAMLSFLVQYFLLLLLPSFFLFIFFCFDSNATEQMNRQRRCDYFTVAFATLLMRKIIPVRYYTCTSARLHISMSFSKIIHLKSLQNKNNQ